MKKFRVIVPFPVWVSVVVEAEDEESAIDCAIEDASITSFVGNGGTDKLVGVYGSNCSIEAGDVPLESNGFEIEAEELKP